MDDQQSTDALGVTPGRLVLATDCHVVTPLFFPGGDIGSLSVHGTINDVAMSGARPLYLAAAFTLEEGLELAELARTNARLNEQHPDAKGVKLIVEGFAGRFQGVLAGVVGAGARRRDASAYRAHVHDPRQSARPQRGHQQRGQQVANRRVDVRQCSGKVCHHRELPVNSLLLRRRITPAMQHKRADNRSGHQLWPGSTTIQARLFARRTGELPPESR